LREAFDDVVPILTNIAPAYEVKIQVLMQIPTPRILFPDKPVVTLSGAAVDSGVIFNRGTVVTSASGSAIVTSNTISLMVKSWTVMSESALLEVYIKAEANNYLSNTKEITSFLMIYSISIWGYLD
jgi:hypothetical protein